MADLQKDLTPEEAYKAIKQLMYERDAKVLADMQWLESNLKTDAKDAGLTAAERDAKFMLRNQVLYCIGHIDQEGFRYSDIEALVRKRFPLSNTGVVLNVAKAMSELAGGETGILQRTPAGDGYMLKHPAFRTCLRAMLRCAEGSEVIEKVAFSGL